MYIVSNLFHINMIYFGVQKLFPAAFVFSGLSCVLCCSLSIGSGGRGQLYMQQLVVRCIFFVLACFALHDAWTGGQRMRENLHERRHASLPAGFRLIV